MLGVELVGRDLLDELLGRTVGGLKTVANVDERFQALGHRLHRSLGFGCLAGGFFGGAAGSLLGSASGGLLLGLLLDQVGVLLLGFLELHDGAPNVVADPGRAGFLEELRAAAPGVPIVGMNVYNPYLAMWFDAETRSLSGQSVVAVPESTSPIARWRPVSKRMRSVSVVLPALMWATVPMLRSRA